LDCGREEIFAKFVRFGAAEYLGEVWLLDLKYYVGLNWTKVVLGGLSSLASRRVVRGNHEKNGMRNASTESCSKLY